MDAPGLSIREFADGRAFGRPARLDLYDDGRVIYEEEPPQGMVVPQRQRKEVIPDALSVVGGALARADFASWPVEQGRGDAWLELAGKTVRFDARGGFAVVAPRAVEVVHAIVVLLDWIAGRRTTATPWEATTLLFPGARVLREQRREMRFSDTHDWDGAKAYDRVLEVRVDDRGAAEHVVRTASGVLVERHASVLGAATTAQLFGRLAALFDAPLRTAITGVELDTTYTQRLAYFDGTRARELTYTFGRERGIGTVAPELEPAEAGAFELARELLDRR
jgi:hypothetical protein